MEIKSNSNNVTKGEKNFNNLTSSQQVEKLKKRKINYARMMHDESDIADRAWYASEITMINLQIERIGISSTTL